MSGSPTQRTLALMRERGYPLVQVVEHWNPHVKHRQDLFGILDVLCVGVDVVGVQTTSRSNLSGHVAKLIASDALPVLRRAGVRVLVHGWRKARNRWVVEEVDLS